MVAFWKEYEGELLTTIKKDGSDQMLPISYVDVEFENKEVWTWFLELLIEDLGKVVVCASCTKSIVCYIRPFARSNLRC